MALKIIKTSPTDARLYYDNITVEYEASELRDNRTYDLRLFATGVAFSDGVIIKSNIKNGRGKVTITPADVFRHVKEVGSEFTSYAEEKYGGAASLKILERKSTGFLVYGSDMIPNKSGYDERELKIKELKFQEKSRDVIDNYGANAYILGKSVVEITPIYHKHPMTKIEKIDVLIRNRNQSILNETYTGTDKIVLDTREFSTSDIRDKWGTGPQLHVKMYDNYGMNKLYVQRLSSTIWLSPYQDQPNVITGGGRYQRVGKSGLPDDQGERIRFTTSSLGARFSNVIDKNSIEMKILVQPETTSGKPDPDKWTTVWEKKQEGKADPGSSDNRVTIPYPTLISNYKFSPLETYVIRLYAKDKLGETYHDTRVFSQQTVMDFLGSGEGVSFGMISRRPGFEVGYPAYFHKPVSVNDEITLYEDYDDILSLPKDKRIVSIGKNAGGRMVPEVKYTHPNTIDNTFDARDVMLTLEYVNRVNNQGNTRYTYHGDGLVRKYANFKDRGRLLTSGEFFSGDTSRITSEDDLNKFGRAGIYRLATGEKPKNMPPNAAQQQIFADEGILVVISDYLDEDKPGSTVELPAEARNKGSMLLTQVYISPQDIYFRQATKGIFDREMTNWLPWREVTGTVKDYDYQKPLSSATKPGVYMQPLTKKAETIHDAPVKLAFYLEVIAMGNGNLKQVFTTFDNSYTFIRTYYSYSNVWYDWRQVSLRERPVDKTSKVYTLKPQGDVQLIQVSGTLTGGGRSILVMIPVDVSLEGVKKIEIDSFKANIRGVNGSYMGSSAFVNGGYKYYPNYRYELIAVQAIGNHHIGFQIRRDTAFDAPNNTPLAVSVGEFSVRLHY